MIRYFGISVDGSLGLDLQLRKTENIPEGGGTFVLTTLDIGVSRYRGINNSQGVISMKNGYLMSQSRRLKVPYVNELVPRFSILHFLSVVFVYVKFVSCHWHADLSSGFKNERNELKVYGNFKHCMRLYSGLYNPQQLIIWSCYPGT